MGDSPLIASAIHNGHHVRDELVTLHKISEQDRFREEDPFTSEFTELGDTRILVKKSRFEVDLNRPRELAVYTEPKFCWGLDVWHQPPTEEVINRSLESYDRFYSVLFTLLNSMLRLHPIIVFLDLHSYNHRRGGVDAEPDPQEKNPDVIVGTSNMDREYWAPIISTFVNQLKNAPELGNFNDVRQNVKFSGGHMARWIHQKFPNRVCVLSVEFKKTFMDEWTGIPDHSRINGIKQALLNLKTPLMEAINTFKP
jgi:N-formylglutamate amidohydrolase